MLTAEFLADARAAGVTEVTALVANDNAAAVSLLRQVRAASRSASRDPSSRFAPRWGDPG